MPGFVDPVLTANVYCNRRMDPLLSGAIAPFWRAVREQYTQNCFFWLFRYGKCGEHVKLRFHGSEDFAGSVRSLLPAHLDRFFADPASDPDPENWLSKSAIPPIDEEDEAEEDYPNKSLLWTHARRSPVLIGAHVYLADDRHVDLFHRAQAAATEIVLDVLIPGLGRPDFSKHRQSQFLKMLLAAFSALDFDVPQWIDYLTYHRDWLIRTVVANATVEVITPESILAELDQRVEGMRSAVAGLSGHVLRGASGAAAPGDDPFGRWGASIASLHEYVKGYRGRPEYDQDPYTRDFAYLPLFKALHGAANQFGFRLSHEAYLNHLLLKAAELASAKSSPAPEESRSVSAAV